MIPLPHPGQELTPFEGLRCWRNAINGFVVVHIHYTADPSRRGDWRYRAAPKYGGLRSWRWRKEQEIDWDAQSGKLVFEMWQDEKHFIRPVKIEDHWPRWILLDPGWTNPASMVWVAVDVDAEPNAAGFLPVHVYREFYEKRHSARLLARAASAYSSAGAPDPVTGMPSREWIEQILVDPAAKQEHQSAAGTGDKVNEAAETTLSLFQAEITALQWDVPVETGNNYKADAIEELIARLGRYWVMPDGLPLFDEHDNFREPELADIAAGAVEVKPTLFVHQSCPMTAREMRKYKWRDWASADVALRHNAPESPVDKDDHSITNLIRYVNLLRNSRDENGPDLSSWAERTRPKEWVPEQQQIEERHRTIASRYRQGLRRNRYQ